MPSGSYNPTERLRRAISASTYGNGFLAGLWFWGGKNMSYTDEDIYELFSKCSTDGIISITLDMIDGKIPTLHLSDTTIAYIMQHFEKALTKRKGFGEMETVESRAMRKAGLHALSFGGYSDKAGHQIYPDETKP